jgi:hypothetical protein
MSDIRFIDSLNVGAYTIDGDGGVAQEVLIY